MSRHALVVLIGLVVFAAVTGAIYLQILTSAHASDLVWAVSRPVQAGDPLTADNVHQTRIPRSGDSWDFYTGDLIAAHARAAHPMAAGTIVFKDDVLDQDLALVTLTLKDPPPLAHGQTIDVYAQIGSQTLIVGRRLVVDGVDGSNASVWVPTTDEPAWVALQANSVALFAARSGGVGVPEVQAETIDDALASLNGLSAAAPASSNPSPVTGGRP
ncbi:MAG TPA: SAF domain-containing protein [Candidatus Dormibacteraeota bacterium]|nr:SAF domain-containing protein [Candidatus Dormibacteraeota bacterium]